MHLARGGEGVEELDLRHAESGVPEEGEPVRQRQVTPFARAQPGHGLLVTHVGRRGVDGRDEPAPQLRLPGQVGIERGAVQPVGVPALAPVAQQLGAAGRVPVEEPGEPQRDRVPSPGPDLSHFGVRLAVGAEVPGEVSAPWLAERVVDDLQQGPDEVLGQPRVVLVAAGEHRDERAGTKELHSRADPVSASAGGAEPVREPLRQPPLDALLGHDDDLPGEGVRQRARQQLAELVGEDVGPLCAVEVKSHAPTVSAPADNRGWYSTEGWVPQAVVVRCSCRVLAQC